MGIAAPELETGQIRLRGVRVNNLKNIDLDVPYGQMLSICGLSGSGKSSLAINTLYAEGQRRYMECFSTFARQYLNQQEKPEAERIDGIPPSVAITRAGRSASYRDTVGTVTETADYLQLLYAKIGQPFCSNCGELVCKATPTAVAEWIDQLAQGTRVQLTFPDSRHADESHVRHVRQRISEGFRRAVVDGRAVELDELIDVTLTSESGTLDIVVDRLVAGGAKTERTLDSIETCLASESGQCRVYWELPGGAAGDVGERVELAGVSYAVRTFCPDLRCGRCLREIPEPQPRLFSFSSPWGACPNCQGLGRVPSGAEGKRGSSRKAGEQTDQRAASCPDCSGQRLNQSALSYRIASNNIADIAALPVLQAQHFVEDLNLNPADQVICGEVLDQVRHRLRYLSDVGLGYLSLDRAVPTLSHGEIQRVNLTRALGSTLVNLLYVLDEPSVGLHPADLPPLLEAVRRLHERRNTIVLIEHEPRVIEQCARVLELGPGAGNEGGKIVFDGTPRQLRAEKDSLTGQFLAGRRGHSFSEERRTPRGQLVLRGCVGTNLKNITVEFPLGVLCAVVGVSGAGKSSLVSGTLAPELLRRFSNGNGAGLPFESLVGDGQIDDVVVVDHRPPTKSSRSNPVTYIKAFDEIRKVFAETVDAKTRNLKPGHFSFNVEGGRCERCRGDGYLTVDMQFLADARRKCDRCHGRRFQATVLEARYRRHNVWEVLAMTARQAFSFFRGHRKVQAKLKLLSDVGLDYLQLGQALNTLSNGELQRLKLASYLGLTTRKRTLFLLEEPTIGLHMADVVRLVDCFDSLIAIGHSVIVVTHNLQLIMHGDLVIELGPGAGEDGGRVVTVGTPEQIAGHASSPTSKYLRQEFDRFRQ